MRDESKWALVHAYRAAVVSDLCPAILCPDCQFELLPIVGADGDPELKCMSCRTVYDIGLGVWDQIRANLEEARRDFKEANE